MSWHPEGHIEPGASSLQSLFSGNPRAKAPIALLSDILSSRKGGWGVQKGCVLGGGTGKEAWNARKMRPSQ